MRHETPAVRRDRPKLVALDDHEHVVGGGHVEARPRIVHEWLGGEDLGKLGRRPLLGEPSAHGGKSSIVGSMDAPQPRVAPDPSRSGPLSRDEAAALLASAHNALAADEFADA